MNLIISEINKRNKYVFKKLFNKHYKGLVIYANGYLFDMDSSKDIVQDVFIYIWEHSGKLNIKTSLKAYLYSMVRNRCLNYLKSIKVTDNFSFLDFNLLHFAKLAHKRKMSRLESTSKQPAGITSTHLLTS